ncbi:MAG: carboxypeptidase-like regulatory domain-containing protein [Paludibacteraceae bacterium]|nr:carboxypeptidase-like regulatory domain-containing protein [Paludibacteraceae bacterium]
MKLKNRFKHIELLLLLLLALPVMPIMSATQEKVTSVQGVVVDAETGEKLPFVQIYFIKPSSDGQLASQYGTTSDMEGNFSISNPVGYTTINFQMIGYKTEMYTVRLGQQKKDVKIKLKADVYGLQDIVVTPKNQKQKYKRKGNPAVELIKNVIDHKDSLQVKSSDHYIAGTYHRMSFALDNFYPNFDKGLWKSVQFIEKYIDTTGVYPSITLSIRENLGHEYYQRKPHREKKDIERNRVFGLESLLSTESLENNMKAVFTDVDIYDDDMNLLFNRFVSPLSSSLAVSYYQYYIMDTIMLDGDSVIDLAFVPVNSESYSFTGHLYIMNDSTFKLKKYSINIPPHINLNFVSHYSVEHEYKKLENGLWAPDRTNTYCKFYLTNRKKTILARQTKLYTDFDFDTELRKEVFANRIRIDSVKHDSTTISKDFQFWDEHRPEPLSQYEGAVVNMIDEAKRNPKFNSLIMLADALSTEYVQTVPSSRYGDSKWDFGPIYNTISWNKLEGVRLRIGGQTTANVHKQLFFSGYVAFGTHDLLPKYNATLMWSFNKKRYHMYEKLRDYIALSVQYDVEQPGQQVGVVDRDNILMSIPIGKVTDKNMQYVFRTRLHYYKEFLNHLSFRAQFNYEYNEAASAMTYSRVSWDDSGNYITTQAFNKYHHNAYHDYEFGLELRYTPGSIMSMNRMGVETPFTLEQDAPVISINHWIGYLDDRGMRFDKAGNDIGGGQGFFYNHTQLTAEKRFWFSSFGHLDARIQTGYIWQKVPFTKLYSPQTSTSIFLGKNAFNQMQPMEFMFDAYVGLYATYFFKGWILNRIPGINRLKLRGVVSFSAIYGGLTKKNNPYTQGSEGLYALPNNEASFSYDKTNAAIVTAGATSSPIGKLPYMELTAGLENIFKFVRIDYIRRLTYNDYELPIMIKNADGEMVHVRRKLGPWGRNGVKVTVRFAL